MMRWLARGLLLGIGFALAAAIIDLGFSGFATISRRMGPGPLSLLRTAGLEIVLGALLGLALAPLLRWRRGVAWHVAGMALAWLGLGAWVRFDAPMGLPMMLAPPIGGLLLFLAAALLARRRAAPAWLAGAVTLALVIFAPSAYVGATTPPATPLPAQASPPDGAPDVVLVVLDTVRARSLGTHGYDRDTSPTLASLADQGALFLDATSPSTWSLPSHASLFTGRYPTAHGAHGEHRFLDDRFPTLAQVLQASGYDTACFTSNAWISDGLGLTRGFAYQDLSWQGAGGAGRNFSFIHRLLDRLGLISGDKGGAVVAERFDAWMRARPVEAPPTFVFLNFIEAHFPYHQLPSDYLARYTDRPADELEALSMALMGQQFGGPGRSAEETRPARDMYDGGVLYTDELLRRVVAAIEARGTLDRTVLVVLADHGEILGERDGFFGHGPSLYQELLSVPLLVRYPRRVPAGGRVETPVSTLSVFATVLDLVGLEPPPTLQAASLVPLAHGTQGSGGPILAEVLANEEIGGVPRAEPQMQPGTRYRMYRAGRWKLVESSNGRSFLFDLAADPGETQDLAAQRPEQLASLRAELEAVRSRLSLPPLDADLGGAEAPALDDATRERLRELGYVE